MLFAASCHTRHLPRLRTKRSSVTQMVRTVEDGDSSQGPRKPLRRKLEHLHLGRTPRRMAKAQGLYTSRKAKEPVYGLLGPYTFTAAAPNHSF